MKKLREEREAEAAAAAAKSKDEIPAQGQGSSKDLPMSDDQWYWNSGSDNYKSWVPFTKEHSSHIELNFNNATKEVVLNLGPPGAEKPYKINIRERY